MGSSIGPPLSSLGWRITASGSVAPIALQVLDEDVPGQRLTARLLVACVVLLRVGRVRTG